MLTVEVDCRCCWYLVPISMKSYRGLCFLLSTLARLRIGWKRLENSVESNSERSWFFFFFCTIKNGTYEKGERDSPGSGYRVYGTCSKNQEIPPIPLILEGHRCPIRSTRNIRKRMFFFTYYFFFNTTDVNDYWIAFQT